MQRRAWLRGLMAAALAALPMSTATAQLRIVDYNIAQNSTFTSDPTGLMTILTSIAAENIGGVARPIDILANQELHENGSETAFLVEQLNAVYGAGMYAAAPRPANAITGGNGLPSLIYNTTTVTLLETLAFGNVGSGSEQQPRSTLRYHLRPAGYDAAADFYLYNSHYKSDDGTADQHRRLIEANSIRADSDALGEGTHALYVGDFNVYRSTEPMYQALIAAGPGQAFDPIDAPGNWSAPSQAQTFKGIHTQSPATVAAFSGQSIAGMDDRFDFQLVTGELLDGEGLSYLPGSYRAFGNNGTHTPSDSITTGTGAAPAVLSALATVSDHLPVVADYQIPAKMAVQFDAFPTTVTLGAPVPLNVFVENIAQAMVAAGADELDYTIGVIGDLIGGGSGMIPALAAGNSHQVVLNTSSLGVKSGTITVMATSQGAAQALAELPVSFTVVGSGATRMVVARDDFDAPLNRTSYSQSPPPDSYTSNTRGFQRYQVGGPTTIPTQLRDDSTNGFAGDTIGVINTATKLDGWFGVADTVNPENPSGEGVAIWTFDVAGASALEISIDMAAMGNFEATGANPDRFDWTYAMDGGAFQPLFTSLVDESATATYTMAGGAMPTADDPLFMTNRANETVQLTNVLQTLTSVIPEVGSLLTLRLIAVTDGTGSSITDGEAYAFDNIIVTGLVTIFAEADFNEDGYVDGADLAAWRGGFGTPSEAIKSQGDADGDGDVDGADFLAWQRQVTAPSAMIAQASPVPEPAAATLLALAAIAWGRRPCRKDGRS